MLSSKGAKAKHIQIDLEKCTGCGICVEFCTRGVLALLGGHAEAVALDKCTVCRLCELRCPEPAILVTDGSHHDGDERKTQGAVAGQRGGR